LITFVNLFQKTYLWHSAKQLTTKIKQLTTQNNQLITQDNQLATKDKQQKQATTQKVLVIA
jgi:uncharacterized protein YoxC